MKKIILLFLLVTTVGAQGNISVKPAAFVTTSTAGGAWVASTEKPASIILAGFVYTYEKDRLKLSGNYLFASIFNMTQNAFSFQPVQGIPYASGLRVVDKSYWFNIAEFHLSYAFESGSIYATNRPAHWGVGINATTLSEKPTYYPSFGFSWDLTPAIHFRWMHGNLKSGIKDSIKSLYYNQVGDSDITRNFEVSRSIAAHRVEWTPFPWLSLGAMETVVYAVRPMEFLYMVPFIPYWVSEPYLGDTDNIQMVGDIAIKPVKNIQAYLSLYMDEWMPETTFDKKENHNWFAWQTGFSWKSLLRPDDRLRLEWTWTDHRIYRHRFAINDLYSDGYPLGFWGGPHAQELFADYRINLKGNDLVFRFSNAKRGAMTDEMVNDNYHIIYMERFSGPVPYERRTVSEVRWSRNTLKGLKVELAVQAINWENAGFNPSNPNPAAVHDVEKVSLQLSLHYNFTYPGWDRESKQIFP